LQGDSFRSERGDGTIGGEESDEGWGRRKKGRKSIRADEAMRLRQCTDRNVVSIKEKGSSGCRNKDLWGEQGGGGKEGK